MSDGRTVSRVEVGLGLADAEHERIIWQDWDKEIENDRDPLQLEFDVQPLEFVTHLTELSTFVPIAKCDAVKKKNATKSNIRPLIQQGKSLAQLFLSATTASDVSIEDDWFNFVSAGNVGSGLYLHILC